jgi:hypothetical protein
MKDLLSKLTQLNEANFAPSYRGGPTGDFSDKPHTKSGRRVPGSAYGNGPDDDKDNAAPASTEKRGRGRPPLPGGAASTEKRGRGRPPLPGGAADTSARYSGAENLQSIMVGTIPKNSRELKNLPTTTNKLSDEEPKKKKSTTKSTTESLKDWIATIDEQRMLAEAGLAVQPIGKPGQNFLIRDPANPLASAITTIDPAVVDAAKEGTLSIQKPGAAPASGSGSQVGAMQEDEGAGSKEELAKRIYNIEMLHHMDRSPHDPKEDELLDQLKAQFAQQFPGENAFKIGSAASAREFARDTADRDAAKARQDKYNNNGPFRGGNFNPMNWLKEGEDEGEPGKNFAKIAKSAGNHYGSKEAGERVAGAVSESGVAGAVRVKGSNVKGSESGVAGAVRVKGSNVKGLHRTQLMLSAFQVAGLSFNHVTGIKDKATGEIIAVDPKTALSVLGKRLGFTITQADAEDYYRLQKLFQTKMSPKDYSTLLDIYFKILDRTRADIPDNLQSEWLKRKDSLGLKGAFLPDDSKLKSYISESGVAGEVRAKLIKQGKIKKEAALPTHDGDAGAGLGAGRSNYALEGMAEAKNHMGETEYNTYAGWKAACRKAGADKFEGDRDICQAMKDGKGMGEWDGASGSVYDDSHKKKKMAEGQSAKRDNRAEAAGKKVTKDIEYDEKKTPSMAHIKKMCKDGKTVAQICKMHPNCNQAELKKMVADCKKKMVAEGMDQRLEAARAEGRAHGLRGHQHCGNNYDDMEEARCYHEGYKVGLDECYGQMPIQGYVGEESDQGIMDTYDAELDEMDRRSFLKTAGSALAGLAGAAALGGIPGNAQAAPKDEFGAMDSLDNSPIGKERARVDLQANEFANRNPKFRPEYEEIRNKFYRDAEKVSTAEHMRPSMTDKAKADNTRILTAIYQSYINQLTAAMKYFNPMREGELDEADMEEGNLFTGNLAKAREAGKSYFDLDGDGDVEKIREFKMAFESLDRQLNALLNEDSVSEGMSVSISKGQEGSPDSVSINASDREADSLLAFVKQAGLGIFGGDDHGDMQDAVVTSEPSTSTSDAIEVVDDHDGMLSLIRKMAGQGAAHDHSAHDHSSEDYADEEENCNECGMAYESCGCDESDEMVDEMQTPTQLMANVDEDNPPDTGAAEVGAEDEEVAAANSAASSFDKAQAVPNAASDLATESEDDEEEDEKGGYDAKGNLLPGGSYDPTGHYVGRYREYDDHMKDRELDGEEEDEDELEESYANSADDTFESDIEFMTDIISGGENKRKSTGQTTIPVVSTQLNRLGNPMKESTDLLSQWKKLSGI